MRACDHQIVMQITVNTRKLLDSLFITWLEPESPYWWFYWTRRTFFHKVACSKYDIPSKDVLNKVYWTAGTLAPLCVLSVSLRGVTGLLIFYIPVCCMAGCWRAMSGEPTSHFASKTISVRTSVVSWHVIYKCAIMVGWVGLNGGGYWSREGSLWHVENCRMVV